MWALYVFIVVIALIVVALSIPVDFAFKFNTSDFNRRKLQFRWFFGLMRVDLGGDGKRQKTIARSVKPAREKEKWRGGAIAEILHIEGLFGQVKKLLLNTFNSFKFKHLSADIIIGPEDPVQYGYLFAFITPVNYLISLTSHRVVINPVFEGQLIIECDAEGIVRAYPLKLLGGALAFTFSGPGLKVLRIAIKRWR